MLVAEEINRNCMKTYFTHLKIIRKELCCLIYLRI